MRSKSRLASRVIRAVRLDASGNCSPPLIVEIDLSLEPLGLVVDLLQPKIEANPLLVVIIPPSLCVHLRHSSFSFFFSLARRRSMLAGLMRESFCLTSKLTSSSPISMRVYRVVRNATASRLPHM